MQRQPPVGSIIDEREHRDAIHIAVAPVVAAENLQPGAHVGLLDNGEASTIAHALIGIVDPYLMEFVPKGKRFFMFLYPNTITTLRHEWEHPSFGATQQHSSLADKQTSELWLRNFCDTHDCPEFKITIKAASGEPGQRDYWGEGQDEWYIYEDPDFPGDSSVHFNGRDAHSEIPDEFWFHLERYLGRKLDKKPNQFSCTC